jgi:predicted nuclease of restriction endonuclease-like RecB superfamily
MARKSSTKAKDKPKAPKKTSRSGFERKTRAFLDKTKLKYEYETERIAYTVPETKKNYIPDFIIQTPSGKLYLECKGRFLPVDRKKILYVLEQNPGINLKLLLMRDNLLRKGSKTKYSTWCRKNGVEFAVSSTGQPPEEWLR